LYDDIQGFNATTVGISGSQAARGRIGGCPARRAGRHHLSSIAPKVSIGSKAVVEEPAILQPHCVHISQSVALARFLKEDFTSVRQ